MSVICGCRYLFQYRWEYLPQVALKAHATILSSTARTTLTQTFLNPSSRLLEEVSYAFPLYDGVSVVGFKCQVGSRVLHSQVKTKEQANVEYQDAVSEKKLASILDQSNSASDCFSIRLGNIPAGEKVTVDITFVGDLKQDAQTDGTRYTIPNTIAPRYSNVLDGMDDWVASRGSPAQSQGISITADVLMEKSSVIRELQSPSHPVKVSLGRISSVQEEDSAFEPSQASASLKIAKGDVLLERDFVLVVRADGLDSPRALLESHPTIPGQRALMATLVPKFSLPPIQPELIFVLDRSGSMKDKIQSLQAALRVFLKSLPVGVCFNICSFGNYHSFLWERSKAYDASSLKEALVFVDNVFANMGGTEMQGAVEAAVESRMGDRELEVLILTDGQIRKQEALFSFVREKSADNSARFFSLGIGNSASHSLIEGIARAGNGFSQSVIAHEELDRKVVRMLKGALTPHIYDYKLKVEYEDSDYDFEVLTSDTETLSIESLADEKEKEVPEIPKENPQKDTQTPISLFVDDFKEPDIGLGAIQPEEIPDVRPPKAIQAPHKIPPLYPFIRTTVYILLDPQSSDRVPKSVAFHATSKQGPLLLNVPISDIGQGETIHQLASRKAVIELEEEHGWLVDAKHNGVPLKHLHANTKRQIARRECERLGIKFQVTGKHCSFVALEDDPENPSETNEKTELPVSIEQTQVPKSASIKNEARKSPSSAGRGSLPPGVVSEQRFAMSPPGRRAAFAPSESPFGRPGASFADLKSTEFGNASFRSRGSGGPGPFSSAGGEQFGSANPTSNPFGKQSAGGAGFGQSVFDSSSGSSVFDQLAAPASRQSATLPAPASSTSSGPSFGQPAGGALFGKSAFGSSSGGSLFGQPSYAPPPTSSCYMYNPTPSTKTTSGGLFGGAKSNTASGGGFGNATSSPNSGNPFEKPQVSLFGSANLNTNTNTTPGGGLFGSANPTPAPPPAPSSNTSSSQFELANSTSTGSSLFGGTNPSTNTNTTNPDTNTNPNPFSGGLFAGLRSLPTPTSGSLFGQPAHSPAPVPETPTSKVRALINLQTFEGSWEWTDPLFTILELNPAETKTNLAKLFQDNGKSVDDSAFPQVEEATVFATLLAMGYLGTKNGDLKNIWELVYEKAEGWVRQALEKMGDEGVVFESCKKDIMAIVV
ncbi:hypothetical protein AWENTII_001786 [Aspergillus wentii]